MDIQWIPTDLDPLAVCNDGSPGAYYYSPSVVPEMSDSFLIFLPGGGQCYDFESCQTRWVTMQSFMTSKGSSPTISKTGILDNDSTISPFYGMNKASLLYCSSDGYMGDVPASASTWNWHFRGQRLMLAMLQDLINRHSLNTQTRRIIFAGSSAGARGMMTFSDQLLHSNLLVEGIEILFILDSPYYIDIPPSTTANFAGFPYQEQQKYVHMNTMSVLSSRCIASYPTAADQWKCQYGEYRMQFLRDDGIPFLMMASQYDAYQLANNLQTTPPLYNTAQLTYAEDFGNQTRYALFQQMNTSQQQPQAYFSWSCYNHAISDSDGFYTVKNDAGVSERDALVAYLATDPYVIKTIDGFIRKKGKDDKKNKSQDASPLVWMDSCNSLNCGKGCSLN